MKPLDHHNSSLIGVVFPQEDLLLPSLLPLAKLIWHVHLPGALVKFLPGTNWTVNGPLVAEGTEAATIVLTSLKDDAYSGDTNNDGKASRPARGDWGSVCVLRSPRPPSSTLSSLRRLVRRHILYVSSNGSATLRHCEVSDSAGQRTDRYSYDAFGAVRSHNGTSTQAFTFTRELPCPARRHEG